MILVPRTIHKRIATLSSPFQPSRTMTSAVSSRPSGPSSDVEKFGRLLKSSKRVLALCGAGLSAASGLDTFRGAGGMWRNHDAKTLATPQAFRRDPGLVWLFYSYRRYKALQAAPNPGHYALTELSKKMPGFITLTQNVDGELLCINSWHLTQATEHLQPFP
jgi:NAD-dependent deacetylase sirtuin 5